MTVDSLENLGDQELIQMALQVIHDDAFNPEAFDRIQIQRKKGEVIVGFNMGYRYVPLNSKAIYGLGVVLNEKFISKEILANPSGYKAAGHYYQPDETAAHVIGKVKQIMGDCPQPDCQVTIIENEHYYEVTAIFGATEEFFKLEKGSGRIYDSGHADLILDEEEEE